MEGGRGRMPSFLLRRGELLHPSDLVEKLWDEVLRGEGKNRNTCGDSEWQICTSEMFTWRGRGSLWAGEWRRTVFYLSRFKTVNQQVLQNREKQDEITLCCLQPSFMLWNRCACVSYLDPGCPFNITGHVEQFIHIYLQLGDGLFL